MSGDMNERSVTSSGSENTHNITRGETNIFNLMFVEKDLVSEGISSDIREPTLQRNLLIVMFVGKDFLCKSTI